MASIVDIEGIGPAYKEKLAGAGIKTTEKLLEVAGAKAVRKTAGLKFTETTKQTELAEELADVQIVLLGLASLTGIDMRKAVAEKEAKNRQRKWL